MVPAVALLCSRELAMPRSRTFKIAVFIEAGTMAFIGVGFGFFNTMINVDPHVSGTLIAIVAFSLAVVLSLIAIWLSPEYLAALNTAAIVALVIVATNLVFPRFDVSDTMRPWERALEQIVPRDQMVLLYKPTRAMEYGLQFYRYSNAKGVGSPEELTSALSGHSRALCIAEDKSLDELAKFGNVDMQVVHTIGNQTAFWVWLPQKKKEENTT